MNRLERSLGALPVGAMPMLILGIMTTGCEQEVGSPAPESLQASCWFGECKKTCNCYWSSDCSSGSFCSYSSGCTHSGKYDGTCTARTGGIGSIGGFWGGGVVPHSAATALLDQGLRAYEEALVRGGGSPSQDLWEGMEGMAPDDDARVAAINAVHNALDVTLGFDFQHPQTRCGDASDAPGNVRSAGHPDAALALLDATRRAMLEAIEARDPERVRGPLAQFWEENPGFHPDHTGRCYPHGHDDDPHRSPLECQVRELSSLVEAIVTSTEY